MKAVTASFVVTLPRSGSTLLRFLLDSHSMVTCPPESQLAPLCGNLMSSWLDYKDDSDFETRRKIGLTEARRASKRLIAWHLAQTEKTIFCDKSLPNVDLAPMLADIFPRARFICLYRNPMDFVASALDACHYGFSAYGLHPYAVSSVDNLVFAMARAWCEKTAAMVTFERRHSRRSLRVRYEDLVRDPTTSYSDICAFLGVPFEAEAVERALLDSHLLGPGDHKIRTTTSVSTASLGRGSAVPILLVPPLGLRSMNELARELNYPEIGPDWNRMLSPLRKGLVDTDEQNAASDFLREALGRRLRTFSDDRPTVPGDTEFRLLVEEFDEPRGFLVDASGGVVTCDGDLSSNGAESRPAPLPTVISRLDALMALCYGVSDITELVDRGEVRVATEGDGGRDFQALRIVDALLFGVAHEPATDGPR